MTLDEVAAELYALPPEEFTAARGEAVAAARKSGDRELAGRIGGLRRPTVGAWLVNLLAHQRPDLVGELLALGEQMRSAQRNLRGDELRELSTQRRAMVSALARESRALAVAAGRGVRAVLPLGEVENTLTAALADPEVAEEVRLGRLVKPIEYAGFGEQPRPQLRLVHGGAATKDPPKEVPKEAPRDSGKPAPASAPASESGAKVSKLADKRRSVPRRDVAEDAELAEFERRAEADHEAARQRAAEQEAARKVAAEQRRRQQTAHRELLAARTALAEAEAQRAEAEKAVRAAKRRVEQALAAVQAATVDPG
ncbi:hypothetical protein [Virgisporangium aurantiacum]|uniref:Uncharacterized protein n=1 Tax=Virgisporangium aurantiacum TaxID=175570 RepID=A0A8J3YX31_9ACTN|nr:hypothetical protein [Virgisporangium aurantiacum]GIJ53554.1 hypothetical protein Vau01_010700 [Virgisporangium aurantiacum]